MSYPKMKKNLIGAAAIVALLFGSIALVIAGGNDSEKEYKAVMEETEKVVLAKAEKETAETVEKMAPKKSTELTEKVSEIEVALTVKEIRRIEGHLLISIFKGKENYNKNTPQDSIKVKVSKKEHQIIFKGLESGEYGIKIIHDENDNDKLDTNVVGIPKEGYGFSNNGGAFGPSPWREAKFEVTNKTELSITLL